jgi:hypothetical protein
MIHGFADLERFDAAHALVDQIAAALRRAESDDPATRAPHRR